MEKDYVNKFLMNLANKVDALIDKEMEKAGYDRGYFEFLLKADILNDTFNKIEEKTLIDDVSKYHYCAFCGKLAYYYLEEVSGYVCAECYKKLKEER